MVFTILKRLRIFFRYDRKLLGDLANCAWRALKLYFDTYFEGGDLIPGAVGFLQTSGELLNFHPHIYLLVTDGGFMRDGAFRPLAWFHSQHVERLFRAEVLRMLVRKELITEAIVDNLLFWRHSGFSAHGAVRVRRPAGRGASRPLHDSLSDRPEAAELGVESWRDRLPQPTKTPLGSQVARTTRSPDALGSGARALGASASRDAGAPRHADVRRGFARGQRQGHAARVEARVHVQGEVPNARPLIASFEALHADMAASGSASWAAHRGGADGVSLLCSLYDIARCSIGHWRR